MQRKYTDSIAGNLAMEPGGPVAYVGFLALVAWYFVSGWAAGFDSDGAGESLFHLVLIGISVLSAVVWAGASLHEIEQFGHSGRLLTSIIWWYSWFWFGCQIDIDGLWILAYWFGFVLFEIPLNIIESIAYTYRRIGKKIRLCYQYGSVVAMGFMVIATITSGFSAFLEHGQTAWFLEQSYKVIKEIIIIGWLR